MFLLVRSLLTTVFPLHSQICISVLGCVMIPTKNGLLIFRLCHLSLTDEPVLALLSIH